MTGVGNYPASIVTGSLAALGPRPQRPAIDYGRGRLSLALGRNAQHDAKIVGRVI